MCLLGSIVLELELRMHFYCSLADHHKSEINFLR